MKACITIKTSSSFSSSNRVVIVGDDLRVGPELVVSSIIVLIVGVIDPFSLSLSSLQR